MKNLTQTQKEFILEHFFRKEEIPGWRNIATKLLDNGECIVAGDGCIWNGGIGNFINLEKAQNAVDCTLYKFDLELLLSSLWFKEYHESYAKVLYEKKIQAEEEYEEIKNLYL